MALHELVPALEGLRDNAYRLAEKAEKTENDLKAAHPDFTLGGVGAELHRIVLELEGQVRTADRPFTVAVVGEFKVGKSTFLNAILGLRGAQALTAKDDPDTACSILIRGRDAGDPEARLHFDGGSYEDTTWAHAVGLTSQVWLNDHPEDASVAARLLEVEYFVASPLLANFQINDLPGTGSRYWATHTELTYKKMKEADAVLWVVGEREPSADGQRDLQILRECAQHVVPIINVFEDPSADPRLPRDDNAVDNIFKVLRREYSDWFSPDIKEPLKVSSKVVLLETALPVPRSEVLEGAGIRDLEMLVERLSSTSSGGAGEARLRRVCGSGTAMGNRISEANATLIAHVDRWRSQYEGIETGALQRLDQVESIHIEMRSRVRTLARDRALKICQTVAQQGVIFVEDTLQISNIEDLGAALKRGGRAKLEEAFKQRFINDYLRLHQQPSWLDELSKDYAEEVHHVAMAQWRQLLARQAKEGANPARLSAPKLEMGALHAELIKAVIAVIERVLGILGVAALLAFIPGGQVIDAVGIVGLLIIAAVSDPLADPRRRAAERVRLQAETQQYEVQNRLLEAGMAGNDVLEKEVRRVLGLEHEQAMQNVGILRQLRLDALACAESARTSVLAFEDALRGRK